MNYTQYVTALISLICKDGEMTPDEIALTESEIQEAWQKGVKPETLYYDIWQQDGGNFIACPM